MDKKKTEEGDEDGLHLAETCGCVYEESSCAGLQFLLLINFTVRPK
jgi:hypothetical protein